MQQKTFRERFRGFDPDEVEDFLERVVETLRGYELKLRDQNDSLEALRQDLAGTKEASRGGVYRNDGVLGKPEGLEAQRFRLLGQDRHVYRIGGYSCGEANIHFDFLLGPDGRILSHSQGYHAGLDYGPCLP